MDKITFRQHLDQATTMLVDFTKTLCFNDIAENFKYRITPNSRKVDKDDGHLTENEITVLKVWNKNENEILTAEQVVDLFHHGNKVPVWIDTTIYEKEIDQLVYQLYDLTSDEINIIENTAK